LTAKNWIQGLLLPAVILSVVLGCRAPTVSLPVETQTPTTRALHPTRTTTPTVTLTVVPTDTPVLLGQFLLGESWEGRPIVAHWFGSGIHKVVAVGNIHGGTEENTHRLALELIEYFQDNLDEVPEEVTLWIIPSANPDGLANGRRSNARGVDLNRNADTNADSCEVNDWVRDTHTSEGTNEGGGGPYPFSEVEARLLRDFLADAEVAVFYHSMAGKIFVTSCGDHPPSAELARILSSATGYPFPVQGWISYPVTGAMVDYLAHRGVAAAEVELTNKRDTEFDENLAGLLKAMSSVDQIVEAP
jgi:hypothetical protein